MAMPRLVLDTNAVLSALLFSQGRLGWLRRAWQAGGFIPLVSQETVKELIRVLAYPKFRLSEADRHDLLADYLPYCETCVVPDTVTGTPECRDPADIPFLKLALAARADALVSGDADLLSVAEACNVAIIPPTAVPERFPTIIATGR